MYLLVRPLTFMEQDYRKSTNMREIGGLSRAESRGFVLVEAIVAVSVVSVVLLSLSGVAIFLSRASSNNTAKIQAAFLAEEGIEAVRILRDNGWSLKIASLDPDTAYYLAYVGGTWNATTDVTLIDSTFERTFVLENVYRNSSYDIVSTGGTLDPNTKKVTVSVSWSPSGLTSTKSFSTYLANIFND